MSWIFSLYVAVLFFILTPAILVRLPPKAGKFTVAAFHAVVFALVLHFTGKIVLNFSRSLEGFEEGLYPANTPLDKPKQAYAMKYCNAKINANPAGFGGVWSNADGCTKDNTKYGKKYMFNAAYTAGFDNKKSGSVTFNDTFDCEGKGNAC
jgi:hypothetical protein